MRKKLNFTKSSHNLAIYIRVSTEEQAENPEGSIRSQEQRLRQYIQLRNSDQNFGEIVGVYIDRARSGKDTNRPELQRMLSAISRKEITMVMVTELSRLSRNMKDFCEMWELMKNLDCQFLSLRENVDTTTAAGEMVIYNMANLAQFERRQVSERVTANINARAARGLYNGGTVPTGYKLIPEKRGYLAIDEEQAQVVRKAFNVFLDRKTLKSTALWLNENGYRLRKQTQGGGLYQRLGHFTEANLESMLKNRIYIGVKSFAGKNGNEETKAVWEPLVDQITFERVQKTLRGKGRKKFHLKNRYPFLVSGIVSCATCGDTLSGKSANGNAGKIPYYEHAWAMRRQACLVKKVFACNPNRVLAKKLEPLVWEQIERILKSPQFISEVLEEANVFHAKRTQSDEIKRLKEKIHGVSSHLEALTERLGELPKGISASHLYKQMEKLEEIKGLEEQKLSGLESTFSNERPAELSSYLHFVWGLNKLAHDPKAIDLRANIAQKLLHKVQVLPEGFKLHFYVGENHVSRELASASSPLMGDADSNFFMFDGSRKLTYGALKRPYIELSS